MRARGIDKNDPRYMTLLKILKAQLLHGYSFTPTSGETSNGVTVSASNGPTSTGDKGMLKIGPGGITQYQLFQLKAQILAYKYLSRNLALPPKLLTAIRTFSMKALQQQQQQQQQLQQPPQQQQQPQVKPTFIQQAVQENQQLLNQIKQPVQQPAQIPPLLKSPSPALVQPSVKPPITLQQV